MAATAYLQQEAVIREVDVVRLAVVLEQLLALFEVPPYNT
jgi:hypothetical protein